MDMFGPKSTDSVLQYVLIHGTIIDFPTLYLCICKFSNYLNMNSCDPFIFLFYAVMIFLGHHFLLALIRARFMLWIHLLKKNTWSSRYMCAYAVTLLYSY